MRKLLMWSVVFFAAVVGCNPPQSETGKPAEPAARTEPKSNKETPAAKSKYDVPTAGTIKVEQVEDEWNGMTTVVGNSYPYSPVLSTTNKAKIADHYIGKRWYLVLADHHVQSDYLQCDAFTITSQLIVKVYFRNQKDLINFPVFKNVTAREKFRLNAYCTEHNLFEDAVIVP
jgi:hypothetical protein